MPNFVICSWDKTLKLCDNWACSVLCRSRSSNIGLCGAVIAKVCWAWFKTVNSRRGCSVHTPFYYALKRRPMTHLQQAGGEMNEIKGCHILHASSAQRNQYKSIMSRLLSPSDIKASSSPPMHITIQREEVYICATSRSSNQSQGQPAPE